MILAPLHTDICVGGCVTEAPHPACLTFNSFQPHICGWRAEGIIKMCPGFGPCPSVKYHSSDLVLFGWQLCFGKAVPILQPVSRPRNSLTLLLYEHRNDGVDNKKMHIHMTFLNCYVILRIFFISRISAAHRSSVASHIPLVSLLFWMYIVFSNAKEREYKHRQKYNSEDCSLLSQGSDETCAVRAQILGVCCSISAL